MNNTLTALEQLAVLVLAILLQAEAEYGEQYAKEQILTEKTL